MTTSTNMYVMTVSARSESSKKQFASQLFYSYYVIKFSNLRDKSCNYPLISSYQAWPETHRTGSASLAIPTLSLVSPDKLDIRRD